MGARPRLLVVITLAEVGGAQAYVMALLPELARRFEVTVAAHGPGPLRAAADAAGARYVPLRHVRRALHPLHDALGLLELLLLCLRVRPHVVHANSSKAGVLARLAAAAARVPVRVFTVHGWAFKAHSGLASRAYLWADRAMRPLTTATVCVARSELDAGLRARTCTEDATVVIPNAVDVGAAPRAALAGEPPLLVSVGRLKEPKTFELLVEALGRVGVPYRAAIAGDGPDRPAVEAAVARTGARVELLGTHGEVPRLLAGADAFVLSSASEGMPISVLEAMAAGLPVVASAVGGVPELVVDGETGLLVPPGDADALADALERVLGDAELRRRMGEAARRRAEEEFDLARFRDAHVALYGRLLAQRGLTPAA